jgi:pimeloyl-ACP methyl ester carboxylesterase
MKSAVVGSGDVSSWQAYYSTQLARFTAYGISQAEVDSMMAGILKDSEVEFAGFAYSLGSTLVDWDTKPKMARQRMAAVGALEKRSIALWGTADTDVPYKNSDNLLKYIPHCKLHSFDGESHMFFMKEKNQRPVADVIADFVLSE